jgi:hypothetical protein
MPPGKLVGFTQMTERPSPFAEIAATTAPDESPYITTSRTGSLALSQDVMRQQEMRAMCFRSKICR